MWAFRNMFFVNTSIKMLFLMYIIIYANLQLRRDNPTKALTFKFRQKNDQKPSWWPHIINEGWLTSAWFRRLRTSWPRTANSRRSGRGASRNHALLFNPVISRSGNFFGWNWNPVRIRLIKNYIIIYKDDLQSGMMIRIRTDPLIFGPPDLVLFKNYFHLEQNINQNQQIQA